ncbi:MAG: magnesium/cobalt efflux protein [Novosphingobium sp. 28-62-57]|uniref:CBS domain-containing protein n=1 Tax=unclassified Novosphingobium TaxID=2644732 RepID=UPI000BDCE463|nr:MULTISPECIES: CBS domain-containing protein [unclassified Novosphingobium]OYW51081.1 MAG: magnesium/cobalt efflux protein [Novosphingobium sp. 12-62-10]OYZ11098.1 MAG: magnesium/cobalt efflux protein [Novosphingobium sp. 28-62-57]OZA39071.1 MAG: magnesium/cobalt efflux protein [Novosphingobium sp. 17-62-9]HQS71478.1 transporter associated domain-containing protein [Novosphingobium sp.]
MPEGNDSTGESRSGDADSSNRTLWRAIRAFFKGPDHDQSLRAQIEEAIDEHEGEKPHSGPSNGDLVPLERQMLRNLLHFSEHDADDVAIPRGEIIAVPASATFDEIVAAFADNGHSRLPVYGESLDEIIGMIHVKDVFVIVAGMLLSNKPAPKDWTSLMRQPLFVPQARGALDVLADMRSKRTHLAVVIDEYSGTDGIITIEDLVEEIIGEIEDEHDDAPQELLQRIDPETWDADARVELDDVAQTIDPRLAEVEEDVDTLGGLAVVLAGEVPPVGRVLEHASGWRLEVTGGDERRLTRLRLHAPRAGTALEE